MKDTTENIATKPNADAANIVAALYKVTPHYVKLIVKGKRSNAKILECYNQYSEGKNLLIKAIEKNIKIA